MYALRHYRAILKIFACTMCLAFMQAVIGVVFQGDYMDIVSLLMVQNTFNTEGPNIKEHLNGSKKHFEKRKLLKQLNSDKHQEFNFHDFIKNLSYVEPTQRCDGDEHKLVALINSARANIERRKTIRTSWANPNVLSNYKICLVFVIGINDDPLLKADIEQEKFTEQDILEGKFLDNTYNNTLKSLTGFTWTASSSGNVPYVLLADDTMFIHFDVLMNNVLLTLVNYPKSFWMGHLEVNRKVTRRQGSINYISDQIYSESKLPPLCSKEAGFVLTSMAVLEVLRFAQNASLISRIDHFLAVLVNKYEGRMKVINNKLFSRKIVDVCELHTLATAPGMSAINMHEEVWRNLSRISFLRTCDNPDLKLVLPNKISNENYFVKVLKLLHANEHACIDIGSSSEESFLVALISSLPSNHERRDAIRRTWGVNRKIENVNIRVLFVMGVSPNNTELYNAIVSNEMSEFHDIIQANFVESFQNLTLKVVLGLKWISMFCNQAQIFYKGDDDMFVNFKRISEFVQQRLIPRPFYLGHVLRKSQTVRRPTSKYFIPVKLYSGKFLPPYCSGGGYIISVDVVEAMYRASIRTPLLPIDDAFQGILANKVGVTPTMMNQFKTYGHPSDHCSLVSAMTVHGFNTASRLLEVWNNYTKGTPYVCHEEIVKFEKK